MNTTHTRRNTVIAAVVVRAAATARRSLQMLIVLPLALGTILLALSMPVAHAGPEDGQDTENSQNVPPGQTAALAPPPQIQASENPVVFHGLQTTKWITTTWKPYMAAAVRVIWTEDGVQTGPGAIVYPPDPGVEPPSLVGEITYGKTYKTHLETLPENGQRKLVGPTLTITTVRVDVSTASPHPPEITINPTLIPRRPGVPPAPGDQGAAEEAPAIDRNPPTVESPGRSDSVS